MSAVRKLIGSSGNSSKNSNGSSSGGKLSGYFQRASSSSSSKNLGLAAPPPPPSGSGYLFRRSSSGRSSGNKKVDIGLPGGGDLCPSCLMPFDKNRKRRLIDSCGHERCYTCLFSSSASSGDPHCPLCSPSPGNSSHSVDVSKLKR